MHIVPTVVDTHIFKPMNGSNDHFKGYLRIGYAGPLHPPRFPIGNIAKALILLKKRGIDIALSVRGLLRHGRRDWPYVHAIERLFKKVLGDENMDIEVRQLSRRKLNKFYNSIDALLYVITLSREAEVADPPLVPLEALSAGTPLVSSSGSSLDYYLKPLLQVGAVKLVENDPVSIAEAIYELSSANNGGYKKIIHEHVDRVFSPKSVGSKIKRILEEAL